MTFLLNAKTSFDVLIDELQWRQKFAVPSKLHINKKIGEHGCRKYRVKGGFFFVLQFSNF